MGATNETRNFILATWVRSYEAANRRVGIGGFGSTLRVKSDVYRAGETAVAEALWELSKVVVGQDGYTVHGWICATPGRLYHVYVPPGLRRCGVAKGLIEAYAGKEYMVQKPWPYSTPAGHTVTYNPFLNRTP